MPGLDQIEVPGHLAYGLVPLLGELGLELGVNETVAEPAEPRSYHIYVSSLMFAPTPTAHHGRQGSLHRARLPAAAGPTASAGASPSTHTVNDG